MTTVTELMQEFSEVRQFVEEKVDAAQALTAEEMAKLREGFEQIQKDMQDLRRARVFGLPDDGRILVKEGRLFGYDALELSMLRGILEERARVKGEAWEGSKQHEMVSQARKSLIEGVTPETMFHWEERALKERRVAYGYSDYNPGVMKFKNDVEAWRTQMTDVVARALDSTTAGSGDELVSTIEAATLWMDVNLDTVVLPLMQQVPMPSNPYDIPLQLGDINWYPGAQNVQTLTTDPSTAKVTMTAQSLRAGVPFGDELTEDAIIALVPELRRSMARNAAEVIDDVLLNADQTVTNGINSDGATIATDTAGKAQWLLGFDGLIHLPLIDNTSQANDHTAAVDADMFNEILSRLGKYAAPRRRGDVAYISDVNTAIRSLSITEFETVDVAGARATLSSGEILNVYGKPFLHSEQMRLADTDGKVTDAGNATDTGRLLVLNTSQWRVGFRRGITMEPDREPGKEQTTLYISFRIALTERSGTRSTATHTALQYNIEGVA